MPVINLRISPTELMLAGRPADGADGHASPAETQRYVLHRMRRAGIPVHGELFFLDLERGELTLRRDSHAGWDIAWRY